MRHRTLLHKLIASFALLLLSVLVILAVTLVNRAEEQVTQYRATEAEGHARSLARGSIDALLTRDYELLERWVASAQPSENYAYAYLSRPDGTILVHVDPSLTGTRITPPPLQAEGQQRLGRYHERPVREFIYPALIGGKHIGNAHVAYYTDVAPFAPGSWPLPTLLLSLGAVIAVAGGAFVIARRVITPINQLTTAVSASTIEHGADIDRGLLQRDDEIGALAQAFDAMFERLQAFTRAQAQEEARLKAAVDSRTQDLLQSNQELKAFCYSVSHDLRSPLRALDGYARVIAEEYGERLDQNGHHYLQRIQAASQRMSDIIDDLLSLSRVTQQELHATSVNLSAMVKQILGNLEEANPTRQVVVSVQEDGWVLGDSRLLRVCLENLLNNAWKFTAHKSPAEISFSFTDSDGERLFALRDNGAGFNMDYADKLFLPFHRLHNQDEFTGTGIGLAIVERVTKRHGARVWADSTLGNGTTLYLAFPLPQEALQSRIA